MKITVLCGDAPNQIAFTNLLHQEFRIENIIVWSPNKYKVNIIEVKKILLGLASYPYRSAWFGMLSHFNKSYGDFPFEPLLITSDINSQDVANQIECLENTLIVVSGTNLLGSALLNLVPKSSKIINLHTGISPYVKGGPNCTNWCLANNQLARIGNTVMWINTGIDSGNLITTEQVELADIGSLLELHIRVMQHAHSLYIRAIRRILSGQVVPSIPQENIDEGKLYLTRDWTLRMRIKGLINYWIRFKVRKDASKAQENLVLVSLVSSPSSLFSPPLSG